MRSLIFSKLYLAVFTVTFLFNYTNSIDIDNYEDIPDLTYFIDGSYKQTNLRRYTRQNTPTCRIPTNPEHTTYKIINKNQTNLSAGDDVITYTVLEIICDSKFSINPIAANLSICINGKWTPPLTNCLRTCPSLNSISSTNVNCKWIDHLGNQIVLRNCINPVEGTTASLSCSSWYEEYNIEKNPIRICIQGKWNLPIPVCYPTCGLKPPKAINNIINGTNTELGDYPWQVGIYNTKREILCGGSILSYRVILSAAHCFTDYEGNKKPSDNYLIAAGKHYRKYDDERDKLAQYSKIHKIHIPPRYKGSITQQGSDIAVLILTNPLTISRTVQPICIELNEESKSLHLSLIKYGTVIGWGYTKSGSGLSDVLKELTIPYIPYEECFQTVPFYFRKYITNDKICGGYINSSAAVCGGDSGGGYIFKKSYSDRHFIKGIVSVSPATEEGGCDPNQYSIYTFVDEYIDFIRRHLAYNQIYQSLECQIDDCKEELQNEEDCTDGYVCTYNKIHCTLPNFPLMGNYSFNGNTTYIPGGYVGINSSLTLSCSSDALSPLDSSIVFNCSDKGEWTPPLITCAELVRAANAITTSRHNFVKCENTDTQVNGQRSCKGKLIFEEDFKKSINTRWTRELKIDTEPDYNFVIYNNSENNLRILNNQLSITPTLTENTFGTERNQGFYPGTRCTKTLGKTQNCDLQVLSNLDIPPVTSAQITTKNYFSFRYGIIEIRAKFPEGDWIYPELYLKNKNDDYGPGLESGLIRIAFTPGNSHFSKTLYGGCVLGTSIAGRRLEMKKKQAKNHWTNKFHTYQLIWKPDQIILMVDNVTYGNIYPPEDGFADYGPDLNINLTIPERWKLGTPLAPFDKEMYIVIGVGVGGKVFTEHIKYGIFWDYNRPKCEDQFKQKKSTWSGTWSNRSTLLVDYVKVWAL